MLDDDASVASRGHGRWARRVLWCEWILEWFAWRVDPEMKMLCFNLIEFESSKLVFLSTRGRIHD